MARSGAVCHLDRARFGFWLGVHNQSRSRELATRNHIILRDGCVGGSDPSLATAAIVGGNRKPKLGCCLLRVTLNDCRTDSIYGATIVS